MRLRDVGICICFGICLLASKPATAALLTGPNVLVDTATMLQVTYTFGPVTDNANYSVGEFNSPTNGWNIGQIDLVETVGAGGDTVSIGGTIGVGADSFDYLFNFDVAQALSGIPPQLSGIIGVSSFAVVVQATVADGEITGYGIGIGAGTGTHVVPEPSSMALLFTGASGLGVLALRKRRQGVSD